MATEFEFGNCLYGSNVEALGLRVGTSSRPVRDFLSKMHEPPTRTAKVSTAAIFLEALKAGKIAFLEGPGNVYFEYHGSNGVTRCVCDGLRVMYEKDTLAEMKQVFPLIAYHMVFAGAMYQKDAVDELRNAVEAVAGTGTVYTPEQGVYIFCDGFYFGFAKARKKFMVQENSLAIETVKAAIDKGALKDTCYSQFMPEITIGKTKKAAAPKKKQENRLAEFAAGKHILAYDFDDKASIPSPVTLNDFEPVPAFYSISRKLEHRLSKAMLNMDCGMTGPDAIAGNAVNCLLVGKPGTGKTTVGFALGAALGLPVCSVAVTKNTEEDLFQGMTKVIDGKLSFVNTDFLKAYKNGGIIIVEEINLADPAVIMGALGQAIEFPYTLMENGYQPVKRHPMTVIIGTMNVGTQGSRELNEALSNRFPQTYILNDPEEATFVNILVKKGYEKKASKWTYQAYKKVTSYLKSDQINANDVCLRLSLRNCIGALQNMEEGEEPKEAIRNTLIGKIAEVDLDLAEDTWNSVVRGMPEF